MSTTAHAAAHATGLPPKVDAWSPGAKPVGARVGDEQRADRQPVREPLRERDGVRPDAVGLPGEEGAATPDAGLHLVEDQQGAVRVRERARLGERLGREWMHAAFALHGLEQDRRRVGADVLGQRLGSREARAGDERPEAGALRRLARDRQRAERAAVEGAVERHHLVAPGCLARPLEGSFDRFGARVAEERLRAAEAVGEARRKGLHRLGPVEVRDVPQLVELLVRRGERRGVAVPEADDRDAGEQVEVALAVGVDEPGAVARR